MGQTLLDRYRGARRVAFVFHYRDGTKGYLTSTASSSPATRLRSVISGGTPTERVDIFPASVLDNRSYTFDFNSWLYTQKSFTDRITTEQSFDPQKERSWSVVRRFTGLQRVVESKFKGSSASNTKNRVDYQLATYFIPVHADKYDLSNIQHEERRTSTSSAESFPPSYSNVVAEVQMEKENMQGEATQESDKQQNTIVTRDEARTDSHPTGTTDLMPYVSSEKVAEFNEIVNRWIALPTINVKTENETGSMLSKFVLPKYIFEQLSKTPNILPFEVYLYSHVTCEIKFVVNANKFQCGKVICSTKFDSYKAEDDHQAIENALTRPHIILDLSTNNEGNLNIPFRFRRALIRNTTHEEGTSAVRSSQYATVYVQVFSRLLTGADGMNNMYIRPFVRLSAVKFAGMSYRAEVQMDVVRTLKSSQGLKGILRDVESLLDVGSNENCDKPTDLRSMVVVPHARMNFPSGKGPIDAQVLRMNPTVMTPATHVKSYDSDPKDMLEIAQIWGLRNTFEWSKSAEEGKVLARMVVDPTARTYNDSFAGTPTPLEYVCSMYNFWAGTIEMRLDFVSNAFHTGAVMVCVEFGRSSTLNGTSLNEACSTYTQTFHLGEQKSIHVTIPYIYDTVWRRSSSLTYNPQLLEVEPTEDTQKESMNIRPTSHTQVVVRVVNPLRPPETVAGQIDVQVFMRASSAFRVHSLKQCSMYSQQLNSNGTPLQNLPRDFSRTNIQTQMDDGKKEDLDPTQDFALGRENLSLQSHDPQTNIKDILRRPALIVSDYTITSLEDNTTMGLFIPLMPPSKMMGHIEGKNGIFSEMVGQTPTASIMNLFRFWRGSMRYTIVVRGEGLDVPIYVTHVPHSGAMIIGNQQIGDYTNPKFRPIYASGLTTEMIIPTVNPSATIEVPYDTINNWTLTFEDDAKANYTWRDKGDLNAGHLVISGHEQVKVDVWWSAGDDFQVANFYGIPACKWDDARRAYTDEGAVVQMEDFRGFDVQNLRSNISSIAKSVTPGGAAIAAVGSIPYVGSFFSGMATQGTISAMKNRVEKSLDKADEVLDETQATLMQFRDQINPIGDSIQEVLDLCKGKIESFFDGVVDATRMSTDLLNAAIISFYSKSYLPLATTLVNFLKDFALSNISITQIQRWVTQISYVITHQSARIAETQASTDPTPTIVGVLVGVIGVLFGIQLDTKKYESSLHGLALQLTNARTFTYLNGVLTYVQRIYTILVDAVKDALGIVNPEVAALQMIVENSDFLRKFVAEAQLLTSEAMRSVRQTPKGRNRYFIMTLQALQIQRALIHIKGNPATVELSKFIATILKKTEEHRMDLTACPIKKVPFVFTIEGQSKIGKSYAVHDLLGTLHDAINIKPSASGMSYTYQSGSAYWTNYTDQHFILMDDYGQRTDAESVRAETDVLFNLATDAPYTPPMAHLEDKRMYANPLGVILLSNDAFASHLTQSSHCNDAYMRRRGHIFRFELTPEYQGHDIETIPAEVLTSFGHLQVKLYKSPLAKRHGFHSKVLTYAEFKEYCSALFKAHYNKESMKQTKRLAELYERINGASVSELNFQDPYELFSEQCIDEAIESGGGIVLIENLRKQAQETVRIAEKSFETIVKDYYDEQPTNPFVQMDVEPRKPEPEKRTPYYAPSIGELLHNPPKTWSEFELLVNSAISGGSVSLGVLMQYIVGSVHNCAKCKKLYGCAYKCTETNQYLCEQCYSDENTCPICNKQHARVANAVRWLALFVVAIFLIRTAIQALSFLPRVGWFFSFYKYMWMFSTSFLGIYGYMQSQHIDDVDSYFAEHVPDVPYKVNLVETQRFGDLPMPTTESVETKCSQKTNATFESCLEVVIDESRLHDMVGMYIDEELPCRHSLLIENISIAHYVNAGYDSFKIPIAGPSGKATFVNVPLNPCGHDCPMNVYTNLKSVCEVYVANRRSDLRALYLDYLNYPDNRDRIKAQIPYFALPEWMDIDVPIPQTWWEWLTGVWAKYGKLIKILGGIIAVLGIIIKMTSMFSSEETADHQFGSSFSGSSEKAYFPRTAQKTFTKSQRQKYTDQVWATAQSATGSLLRETAAKVFRNQVLIKVWSEGKVVRVMGAVGVRGRNVLLPLHYYREMKRSAAAGLPLTIEVAWARSGENNHTRKPYTFSEADFAQATDTDLAMLQLPESYPLFKDISTLFVTERDMNQAKAADGILVVPNLYGEYDREIVRVDLDRPLPSIRTIDVDQTEITTRHVIPYNFSEKGACGSILLTSHPLRPITTMHTCGVPNGPGFGVIVTQEVLAELMTGSVTQMEEVEYEEFHKVAPTILYDENTYIMYHGAVQQSERPYMQKKSKIEPTKLNNNFGFTSKTEPAILDSADPRWKHSNTPLYHGVMKHGVAIPDFKTEDVYEVERVLYDQVVAGMRPVIMDPKRLSVKEAIVGLQNVPYYDALKLTTSAGYPWTNLKSDKSKLAWIEPIRNKQEQIVDCKVDELLEQEIMRKENLRKRGIVPHTLFCDTLKDERRKPEKLKQPACTRVFCASPVDYTIAMRQNFLHFCAAMMKNRLDNHCAVGISPLGPEWSKLAHRLNNISATNVFSLDYSNFGPGFHAILGKAAMRIMARWSLMHVSGLDPVELEAMAEEVVNSLHIAQGTVYQQMSGSPSGAAITAIINSIVNLLYLLLAWRSLAGETARKRRCEIWAEFFNHVYVAVYGDDLVASVSDDYVSCYNPQAIIGFLQAYGIVATDASKVAKAQLKPLTENTFLKRGFKPHPRHEGIWVAPLDWDVIEEIPQWKHKGMSMRDALDATTFTALVEAHGHGEEVFNSFRGKLNDALRRAKVKVVQHSTWDSIDALWFEDVLYGLPYSSLPPGVYVANLEMGEEEVLERNISHKIAAGPKYKEI